MIIRKNYVCDVCKAKKTIDITHLPEIEQKNYFFPDFVPCGHLGCQGNAYRTPPYNKE